MTVDLRVKHVNKGIMSTKVIFLNYRSEVMNNELKVEKFLMMPSSAFKKKPGKKPTCVLWQGIRFATKVETISFHENK